MPSYLLEVYVSKADSLPRASEEARRLADGGNVRYVRTTFLREDETCFHVFEARSREAVVEAARRAGLPNARVTEAIEGPPESKEEQ
jgi:uncharacterized protein DUF4242